MQILLFVEQQVLDCLPEKKDNDNDNDNDNRGARGRHTRGEEAPTREAHENLFYFFYESVLTSYWLRGSCRVGR